VLFSSFALFGKWKGSFFMDSPFECTSGHYDQTVEDRANVSGIAQRNPYHTFVKLEVREISLWGSKVPHLGLVLSRLFRREIDRLRKCSCICGFSAGGSTFTRHVIMSQTILNTWILHYFDKIPCKKFLARPTSHI
jgi:hypothetical protein